MFFDGLQLGTFDGGIAYTIYPGSRLIQQEALMTTYDADVAHYYDAGIVMRAPGDEQPGRNMRTEVVYYDTSGKLQKEAANGLQPERIPLQGIVKLRAVGDNRPMNLRIDAIAFRRKSSATRFGCTIASP